MKIKFDKENDILTIIFRETRTRESDEIRPNVIADFGYDGKLVRLEILDAQSVVKNTHEFLYVFEEAI